MKLLKPFKLSNPILSLAGVFVIVALPFFYQQPGFYVSLAFSSFLIFIYLRLLKRFKSEEERRQLTEAQLSTLQSISIPLNATLNLTEVLEVIVQSARQLLPAVFSLIEIMDRNSDCLVPRACAGKSIKLSEIEITTDSPSHQVLEKRALVFLSDLEEFRSLPRWAKNQRFKTYLGLPIFRAEDIIGVLSLYFQKCYHLSDEEKGLISIFVSHIGSAIENAELYSLTKDALNKEVKTSIMLYRIEHSIASGVLLEDQLRLIISAAADITSAQRAALWLLDDVTSELICKTCYPPAAQTATLRLRLSQDITGWIYRTNQPANIPDLSQDHRFINLWEERVVSMLGVPLNYKGKTIGVLNVYNKTGNMPFNEEDERLLTSMSHQASIAIGASWMYEKLKGSALSLAALYEINRSIVAGKNMQEMLDLILDKAIHVFHAENGSIMLVDEDSGLMSIKIARGLSKKIIATTRKKAGDGSIAGWVAKEKQPLLLIGQVEDERFRSMKEDERVKDAMSAPLLVGNKLIGVFNISNKKEQGCFTDSDLKLLSTFAYESAIVIDTNRRHRQVEEKARQMERQVEVLSRLKEIAEKTAPVSTEIEKTLQVALSLTMELLKVEIGIAMLLEDDEFKTKVAQVSQHKPRVDQKLLQKQYRLKKGDDLVKWMIENNKPLIINHFESESRFRHPASFKISNLLVVPLVIKEEVVGIIEFINKAQPFGNEDITIAATMAEQLNVSIEKASTFEDINRRALELNTVQAITRLMESNLNLSGILTELTRIISQVMKANKAWILFLDKPTKRLTIKASFGLNVQERLIEDNIKIGQGISGYVALEEHPLLIKRLKDETRLSDQEKEAYRQEASYLSVPLLIGDKLLGVLSVCREDSPSFNEKDLEILVTISESASLVIESALLYDELQDRNRETVKSLAVIIEARDPFTKGHSDMVAKYAVAIGIELKLPQEELTGLYCAGLLHDIGKIGVREELLVKRERELNEQEYEEIRKHPSVAVNILSPLKFLHHILPLIAHHHERYEGGGYINGLSGEDIPLGARILAVADAFDAMTSDRAFRQSLSEDKAIEELKHQSGKQFDPKIVAAFLKVLPQLKKRELNREYQ